MRFFWSLLAVQALVLAANCATNDAETAQWVLSAVCGAKLDLTPRKDNSVPPPPCNKEDEIKLDPTGIDPTIDCTTVDNLPGICVLYYQCNPATKVIIDDGATIFDVRMKQCPHYLEVCCLEKEFQNVTLDAATNEGANTAPDRHNNADKQTDKPSTSPAPPGVKNVNERRKKECGWSNTKLNIPGAPLAKAAQKSPIANFGDFPFMVALLRKIGNDGSQDEYIGGGTLIHPSVVLTAAHKLTIRVNQLEPSDIKCRAGEWDTQTTLEPYPYQDRNVTEYIIHEAYYRKSLYNDIALLFLESPFELKIAPHIGTGCLATNLPPPESECYSMGWGKEEFKKNKAYAVILKKVKLQHLESQTCQNMLRKTRLGYLFELHRSLTCANGEPGIDTCRGDGGSPLVCAVETEDGETKYAVYGLVAYGIDCGNPRIPGVYVNVPELKSWVDEKMLQNGYTADSYTV